MFAPQHEADGPSNFCKYHLSYSDLTEGLFANTDKWEKKSPEIRF